ncbi:MAG: response regulator [Oscillospiraceae bacterium]|nr:response regulator [Oscillospiraceae bacterium]
MKKIVLIGKMNEHLKNTYEYLRKYFYVQLCAEGAQKALGMVKVIEPDIIVISLEGFSSLEQVIFAGLQKDCFRIPVITFGTSIEKQLFRIYYNDGQFENYEGVIDPAAAFSAVCKKLGLNPDAAVSVVPPDDNRKKVLVVDDNASTLRSIKSMLEEKYNVTLANSGMKAMTSIGKNRPDVILLDYEMPVCDGRQTLEMIRADEDLSSIPVIFLTSVNDKEHIHAVIKLLPAGYLLKPAVPERLIETIEKALEGKSCV